MRQRLKIDLAQQGNVFLAALCGILAGNARCRPVIDSNGNKVILVASAALVASGMAGFAYAHSFGQAAIPAVLLGLGRRRTEHVDERAGVRFVRREARADVERAGNFYGIGALGIPLLVAVIAGHFRCAATLICAGWPGSVRAAVFGDAISGGECGAEFFVARGVTVARYPGCWCWAFCLFCQSGTKRASADGRSTFVGETGLGARRATLILAGYWAALMVEAVGGAAAEVRGKRQLVLGSGLGAACGSGHFVDEPIGRDVGGGGVLIGLSYGACSDGVGDCRGHLPEDDGTVFGLLFAICARGRNVVPVGGGTNFTNDWECGMGWWCHWRERRGFVFWRLGFARGEAGRELVRKRKSNGGELLYWRWTWAGQN